MDRESALRQVKVMLDIATRDTTPVGEAQAAMAKAHVLMQKYAIDERSLGDIEASKGRMADAFATTDISKRQWCLIMAVPVSKMTMTYVIRAVDKLHFYGRSQDVELALFAFDGTVNMIEAQAAVAFKQYAAEYKDETGYSLWTQPGVQGKRSKYMKDFMKGAAIGFAEALRKAEEDAKVTNAMAIVAMSTRQDEAEAYALSLVRVKTGKIRTRGTVDTMGAFEQGKVYGAGLQSPKGLK